VVLNAVGDNKAFSGSNIVHDELLEDAGIEVADVLSTAVARHAESVIAISSAENVLLLVGVRIHLQHMVVEVMGFRVLGAGDISGHDTAWLEGNIHHHLEHVGDVVFDATSLEESALLVIVHLHVTTTHLDHTIVDSFVGVLKRFEVGVFQCEKGA